MFSVVRKVISQRFATRAYAARAIYVANLHEKTGDTELRNHFGKYGDIVGIRLGQGQNGYKYAHVYFGVGTVPVSETNFFAYSRDHEATADEIRQAELVVQKAEEENQYTSLNERLIVVRSALYRASNGQQPARTNRGDKEPEDVTAFNRGFIVGYRKGVDEGRRLLEEVKNASSEKA
ncbi:hypothetical protein GGI04_000737 [Coemansia thaxteri]|uniref:RRM domain-containing protein n=1 Tax=Coemansia thaxteri TaxID=2663907 RepID=A0A9W8BH16_9FUNG|nr:hypothetical protein H4R26_003328 [Coemansia thaxteri]KAJ2009093.1 hypothetical protein GGI04_000737 [Coemansia thaxteri]KAJ2473691.1 hypothetical protein GGI02_000665 [Coemansia sp. RSA 2322]KAJ2484536.1 hypothetical protein EV174_002360 [Coemansia sp. RSA 2320]